MTTQSWSSRVRHDDNATFQEWASELYTKIVASGLVQTADTGQLAAPVVAARPSTNTSAGFWIFRFNDAMQSTAPIFLRVEVGTGSGATNPRINITVGTGTNGAGTVTGTALTTSRTTHQGSSQATDTARQSIMCHTEGFFGYNWKIGSAGNEAGFWLARTVDATGTPTATGAIVAWSGTATTSLTATQALRFAATAAAYTAQTTATNTALGLNPQTPSSGAVGSDIQAYVGYTITPQVAPLLGVCGVIDSEVSTASTFSATLVGTTPHTYIACSPNVGPFGPVASTNTGGLKFAMLWE